MSNGIDWALERARHDLKVTGRVYRMESTRQGWLEQFGPDSLDRMVKVYEESCNELRGVIRDLEMAKVFIDMTGVE